MRKTLLFGKRVGKLEVTVDGTLSESLKVKFKKNGRTYYQIVENLDSRLCNETNIADLPFSNTGELENYVRVMAKITYHVPWKKYVRKQPRVIVEYLDNETLAERDIERASREYSLEQIHRDISSQEYKETRI